MVVDGILGGPCRPSMGSRIAALALLLFCAARAFAEPAAGPVGEVLKGVLGEGGGKGKPAPSDVGEAARGLLKGLTGQ